MRNLITKLFVLQLSLVFLAGCLKAPDYPKEPVLTFSGLSRNEMVQGSATQDSIRIFLEFTDGDGDISFEQQDTASNVFVVNSKTDEIVAKFKFDPIVQAGAQEGISGQIQLNMYTTCCDYPDWVTEFACTPSNQYPRDTLLLKAYMFDKARNKSNEVEIAPVYLICNKF